MTKPTEATKPIDLPDVADCPLCAERRFFEIAETCPVHDQAEIAARERTRGT